MHVEMTSNTLIRRYELMVHKTVDVKEFRELFNCPSYIGNGKKGRGNEDTGSAWEI
jgi:hypothetical protein